MKKTETAAIIAAGGTSNRMNGIDKQFASICGVPVLAYSMLTFEKAISVSEIVVVTRKEYFEKVRNLAETFNITKLTDIISAGENRVYSVLNGIAAVIKNNGNKQSKISFIAIHDGARPLVSVEKTEEVIDFAKRTGAAILAVPIKDTVKRTDGNVIIKTPDRRSLFSAQTPQVFNLDLYRKAVNNLALNYFNNNSMLNITDDSAIFEAAGIPVSIVEGEYDNIKITTKEDLRIMEAFLSKNSDNNSVDIKNSDKGLYIPNIGIKIGTGYDVHCFAKNRRLILGGVEIPCEFGLLGHSDADVLTHAVMDSFLGALALGDIGKHFPDNNERFKDAESLELLSHVVNLMHKNGYIVGNLDTTIIAEKPKLSPYIMQMRENIAAICKTSVNFISIKATTEEGLGLSGNGIGAYSSCILQKLK